MKKNPPNTYRTLLFALLFILISIPQTATGQTLDPPVFEEKELVDAGYSSRKIVLGDLDRDGELDAVVGRPTGANRLLLNNGGTFTDSLLGDPTAHNGGLALGDIDGDGDLDLAVGIYKQIRKNADGSQVQSPGINIIYLNTVDSGQFSLIPHAALSNKGDLTRAVAWADFDGDGDLDLAVGNQNQPNKLYINDGIGQFQESTAWQPEAVFTESLAWGDVDNDRDPDLLVGNQNQPNQLYLNINGELVLSDWQPEAEYTRYVAFADIDNDGDLDISVANDSSPSQIYVNRGGIFTNRADHSLPTVDESNELAWGDVDNDGDLDLAIANRNANGQAGQNRLYINQTGLQNNQIRLVHAHTFPQDSDTRSVAWGDIDNDGNLDLVFANTGGHDRIYRNESAGFRPLPEEQWPVGIGKTTDVAVADYDLDGDPDLAVANEGGPLLIYKNDNESIVPEPLWSDDLSEDDSSLAWGDFNNDGYPDLAVGNRKSDQPNRLYLNDTRGGLTLAPWNPEPRRTLDLAWGDVDKDGDLDLVVANDDEHNQLFLNQNDTLVQFEWAPNIGRSHAIDLIDVDNDSDLDIVVANGPDRPIQIFLNRDNLIFSNGPDWFASDRTDDSRGMAWGDVNNDGLIDVAVANWGGVNRLYINNTLQPDEPQFTSTIFDSNVHNSADLTWADTNNDGNLELAVIGPESSHLFTFDGGATPQHSVELAGPSDISAIAWQDFDHEGDLDLVVGRSEGTNQLWENRYINLDSNQGGLQAQLLSIDPQNTTQVNTLAIPFRLFSASGIPVTQIRAEYLDENGQWQEAKPTEDFRPTHWATADFQPSVTDDALSGVGLDAVNNQLHFPIFISTRDESRVAPVPVEHHYRWDLEATGFTGKRDDVVVRLLITPGCLNSCQQALVILQTQPMSLNGNIIRVMRQLDDGELEPAGNALVYRSVGEESQFTPLVGASKQPLRTDSDGYLTGNVSIESNQRLFALAPVTITAPLTGFVTITESLNYVEHYWASGAADADGSLTAMTVSEFGEQTLVVSEENPFILFNLAVSLEWDARNDREYEEQLAKDLRRTSAILFDITNGQAALGEIHVFHDKGFWGQANIVVNARNTQRPSAILGGNVLTRTTEVVNGTTIEYVPGQIRMPPVWNKFGDPEQGTTGDDWAQVLAHELGHYLFGIPDNYLGFKTGDILTLVDCKGSIMTDPFAPDYSELLNQSGWEASPECAFTIANTKLGRTDWDSVRRWFPALRDDRQVGDSRSLPIDVTQVGFNAPSHPAASLDEVEYFLLDEAGNRISIPNGYGQAYLLRGNRRANVDGPREFDALLDLGRPVNNLMVARGASTYDRLCVSDTSTGTFRQGCRAIDASAQSIQLTSVSDWEPNVDITPVNSTTVRIAITGIPSRSVEAQMIPALGEPSPIVSLTLENQALVGTTSTPDAALYGHIRICSPACVVSNSEGNVHSIETTLEFTNMEFWQAKSYGWGAKSYGWGAKSYGWGAKSYGWGAKSYGWGAKSYAWGAPLISLDGQVSVFAPEEVFSNNADYLLQRIDILPNLPSWTSPIGNAYRFEAETSPVNASILFQYLGTDVPPKAERSLSIYFSADDGATWTELATEPNAAWNLASALMPGTGIYVLAAAQTVSPPLQPGCNSGLGYSMVTSRSVFEALASIEGDYTSVYAYDPLPKTGETEPQGWQLYDATVPQPFASVVNSLEEMVLNGTYYIHVAATEPVTVSLPFDLQGAEIDDPDGVHAAALAAGIPTPATFYGWITPTVGFTPTVAMLVTATIDGVEVGRTEIQEVEGRLAYVMQVDPISVNDCGATDNEIIFAVGGAIMAHNRMWDNTQAQFHSMSNILE